MNGPEVDNRPTLTTKNQEQQLLQRLVQLPLFVRLAGRQLQVLLKASRGVALERILPVLEADFGAALVEGA